MKFFMQVELEDPVENIGAKLVRQAASKTNDMAGDGTTTSVVLAQGFINEGVKVLDFFFFFCVLSCCICLLIAPIKFNDYDTIRKISISKSSFAAIV